MGLARQARLLVWREIWARGPLYLLLAAAVALTWVAGGDSREIMQGITAVFILALSFGFGMGAPGREEAFWVGLGGSPRLRELVPASLHVAAIVLASVCMRPELPVLTLVALMGGLACYALAGLGRIYAATTAGRLGVLTGVVALAATTLVPSGWIGAWPLLLGLAVRIGLLAVVSLVARFVLASSRPASAAGRKSVGGLLVVAPLATALAVPVEALWPTPVAGELSSDGQLVISSGGSAWVDAHAVWRVTDEGYERTGLIGRIGYAVADPASDNIVVQHVVDDRRRLAFWVGEELVECSGELFTIPDYTWFSGDSVVVASSEGRVVEIGADGCSTAFETPSGLPTEMKRLNLVVEPTADWRVVTVQRPDREPHTVQLVEDR